MSSCDTRCMVISWRNSVILFNAMVTKAQTCAESTILELRGELQSGIKYDFFFFFVRLINTSCCTLYVQYNLVSHATRRDHSRHGHKGFSLGGLTLKQCELLCKKDPFTLWI